MEFGIGERVKALKSTSPQHAGQQAVITLASPYSSGTVFTLKFDDGTLELAKADALERVNVDRVVLCSLCGDPGTLDNPIEYKKTGEPIHRYCKDDEETPEKAVDGPAQWACIQCDKTFTDAQKEELRGKCDVCRIPLQKIDATTGPKAVVPEPEPPPAPISVSSDDKKMLELHQEMQVELFLQSPDGQQYLLKGKLIIEDFQKAKGG